MPPQGFRQGYAAGEGCGSRWVVNPSEVRPPGGGSDPGRVADVYDSFGRRYFGAAAINMITKLLRVCVLDCYS